MYELLNSEYNKKRIDELYSLILEVASGNFDVKGRVTENSDDIDAIISGINMLLEELKASTVSRDYFNSIYNSIVDLVFIFDTHGRITSVNDEVKNLLEFDSDELEGKHFYEILSPKSRPVKQIFDSLKRNKSFQSVEKILLSKSGHSIYTTCSGSLLYDSKHNISGVLCIARDISKLKKYEQALVKKNKEMDTFVYKASHDIKGPLVSIKGLADIAKLESNEEQVLNYLDMISKTAGKLNQTLVTLLKLAVSDNILKDKKSFNVNTSISSVLLHLKEIALKENVSLINTIDDSIFHKSNEVIFCTIIQNLVENGIKYRSNSGYDYIKLSAEKIGPMLKLKVSDNGLGIPKEQHSRIFEIFFRGNKTLEGSGLGLYIVHSHIEKLNGTIAFESAEGQGTTFYVNLPDL